MLVLNANDGSTILYFHTNIKLEELIKGALFMRLCYLYMKYNMGGTSTFEFLICLGEEFHVLEDQLTSELHEITRTGNLSSNKAMIWEMCETLHEHISNFNRTTFQALLDSEVSQTKREAYEMYFFYVNRFCNRFAQPKCVVVL